MSMGCVLGVNGTRMELCRDCTLMLLVAFCRRMWSDESSAALGTAWPGGGPDGLPCASLRVPCAARRSRQTRKLGPEYRASDMRVWRASAPTLTGSAARLRLNGPPPGHATPSAGTMDDHQEARGGVRLELCFCVNRRCCRQSRGRVMGVAPLRRRASQPIKVGAPARQIGMIDTDWRPIA